MENNIELKNVSKKYKDFELKDISFNVQGCIVGLIGENGAGKTTTIKSILNITKAEGDIKIFGKDNKKDEKEIKEKIGVVLEDSFLSDYLTAKQINSIMKDIYEIWDENKYRNLLKQFNLPTNKLIKDFSSGMKMKLKIATAISHNSKVLILDEPTSGLDPVVRNEILDIFRKYVEEDETRSILFSTHITTDLEHLSDYILFIENGKIIFNNTPLDVALRMLEKRFNVTFKLKNARLKTNAFTGTFTEQRLERILEYFKISSKIQWRYLESPDIRDERSIIEVY